jgi:hypothetical protein
MKITQQKPPSTEMNRGQLCEHFNITLPTLRKLVSLTDREENLKKERVFRNDDLIFVFNLIYYYQVKKRLDYLFYDKKISLKRLNYHISNT